MIDSYTIRAMGSSKVLIPVHRWMTLNMSLWDPTVMALGRANAMMPLYTIRKEKHMIYRVGDGSEDIGSSAMGAEGTSSRLKLNGNVNKVFVGHANWK